MTSSLPAHMKAITFTKGADKKVVIQQRSDANIPKILAHELLIKVAYAGVNHADIYQSEGKYPMPVETANIPGLEVSGEVVARGKDCTQYEVGDKVCALLSGGGYAEYCAVAQAHALPIMDGMSMVEAAALPEALATVWLSLFMKAALKPKELVLIHGGSSGIGTTAIMLTKLLGATPIVTAGTDEKCAVCRELGAIAINYKTQDFALEIQSLTENNGVDVVLDMVGGDYIEKNLKCLKREGRMVSIALINGGNIQANISPILLKNLQWQGVTLRPQSDEVKAQIMQALQENIMPLIQKKQLSPVVDSVFLLEDWTKAHEKMRKSLHIGKIILEI